MSENSDDVIGVVKAEDQRDAVNGNSRAKIPRSKRKVTKWSINFSSGVITLPVSELF